MSSCRTSRGRDAPSAVRIAISPLRAVARASSRLATLPQAMSRTSPTAPMSMMSDWAAASPTTTSRYGTSRSFHVSFSGYSCSSWRAIPSISRCACATVTPGARRPRPRRKWKRRTVVSSVPNGTGRHTWTSFIAPSTSGGSTPTMMCGRPSIVTLVPTTEGFSPNRCCQSPCEMMATSCAPCSSSARNARPRNGWTPRVEKKLAVAIDAGTRSGLSPPLITALPKTVRAASDEKSGLPLAVVEEVGRRDRRLVAPFERTEHVDELLGSLVGQRLDEHRVDDAEHRAVGADADAQREHDENGECRAAE